jgi:transposase
MLEGTVSADQDGLARLVHTLGPDAYGCVEMMSGAVWVREQLQACGWRFSVADARKVKAIAPLACKTDKVDARVLAQLAARDLVPELWVPSLTDRELRERLRRREHLVHLRTSARNRMFGLLTQWGLRGSLTTLRKPGALERLAEREVPAVWIQSIRTLLEVVDDLDRQITTIEQELRPIARTDPRVRLLVTVPGLGYLLALTIVAEIGDISRFPNARKLIGYAGLAPTIKQSGQSSWVGPISKAGSPMLRWAAVEAAQHAWRPTNPWNQLYTKTKARHGKANPAKSAVARKVLIACWHVLSREQEFRPAASILTTPAPASSTTI